MSESRQFLRFPGVARPLELRGCPELLPQFRAIYHGRAFAVSESPRDDLAEIDVRVTRTARGYRIESPWIDGPETYDHPVNAACALTADMIRSEAAEASDRLYLHCASIEVEGKLIVIPSTFRAGKSLLSVTAAAAGYRLFGDDILPIELESGLGRAIGIQPRLRLPLPEQVSQPVRRFVEANSGAASPHYLYLKLEESLLARAGATAPIGAFLLLERQESGPADVISTSAAEALRHAIRRNFARERPAPAILDRLLDLASAVPCWRLRYSEVEDAVALLPRLLQHSGERPTVNGYDSAERLLAPAEKIALRTIFRRRARPAERALDGGRFLADESLGAIYEMNPLAGAVWQLLAQPIRFGELLEVFNEAFPEQDSATLQRDLAALIATLEDSALVERDGS